LTQFGLAREGVPDDLLSHFQVTAARLLQPFFAEAKCEYLSGVSFVDTEILITYSDEYEVM